MISNLKEKNKKRRNRKRRIRMRITGTPERPRLTVFRSACQTYAQVIDDQAGKVLVSASTIDKELRDSLKGLKKADAAEKVGQALAERCKKKDVTKVVFDRNGYSYHGRVARLAAGAREKGLSF
jgi:large subunit ribosomal protein L18